jgi:hypothetical protein
MSRPSHREIYKKIQEAKKEVSGGNVLIVNQESVAADALELGYLIECELISILQKLLDATAPKHYAGSRPPKRSYEREIEGLELFAFVVESSRFKCRVYYKFALVAGFIWLVSLHQDRGKRGNS